ncbi:alpha/beta hydrolase [Dactylosporangium sp. NPDC005572]|uniref:alpha/beta fold hydrolase n=1 Tax=Dactylosporangium sp. NPDC005572 TaxID=3156889 RepID=UPI0033BE06F9
MTGAVTHVKYGYVDAAGVRVFHRSAGPDDAPALLALHGFPSGSHQYRRLIDALAGEFRIVAPDYPGFGFTEVPDGFEYSFERLTDVVEAFCAAIGLRRFVLYAFDFGGPVGMRLAERHPEWIAGLVVQNANAYEEGLSDAARGFVAAGPDEIRGLFTLEATRGQYEGGAPAGSVAPESWLLDQHLLTGREEAQTALALDYRSNVARYPAWQAWLREHRPPTLVVWGRNDPFFTVPGAEAYRRDVPDAAVHLFDTGHFALESHLPEIAPLVAAHLRQSLPNTSG